MSNFTKHKDKDKTHITEKHNAIYIFPGQNCPDKYFGQNSKKIQTRLTEQRNAINRHDHSSLPAKHTDDNGHKFDWSQTRCLGQVTTKHAREFKEAWHCLVKQTFNCHIYIPTIYLQLKRSHKSPNSSYTFNPTSTSFPSPSHDNNNHQHSIETNGKQHTEIHQPQTFPQTSTVKNNSAKIQMINPSDEDSKYRVESSIKQIITILRTLYNL
jgi:hypothetical protein